MPNGSQQENDVNKEKPEPDPKESGPGIARPTIDPKEVDSGSETTGNTWSDYGHS